MFLRVLEYYSGILSLTTNRVGALDEAFRSRVHVSLWYPHLSRDDTITITILHSNLQRLPRIDNTPPLTDGKTAPNLIKVMDSEIEDFVTNEYTKYARANNKKRRPWNGRQIRNAVQIAACLALYQKETESPRDSYPAVLTAQHFKSVADTTAKFEKFLKITRVGDESYLARQRQDRADSWDEVDDYDEEEAADYSYEPFGGHSKAEGPALSHKAAHLADERLSPRAAKTTKGAGPLTTPTAQRGPLQLGAGSSMRKSPAPQSSARSSRPVTLDPYDDDNGRNDDYDYDVVPQGRRPRRLPPEDEDDPMGECGPDEYNGSRRSLSSPFGLGSQDGRDREPQRAPPRRDDRIGGGYGGERRQQRRQE